MPNTNQSVSKMLREVHKYAEACEVLIKRKDRPAFHLSPRIGWLGLPCGMTYFQGEYHLFYQYNPFDLNWGTVYWGHAVSKDLLEWRYIPAALGPDKYYDVDGCLSGSSIVLPDGRHLLMYTGVMKEQQKYGGFCEIQRQFIAVGDGLTYIKYENNPVLDEKDMPVGNSKLHFRDPQMWRGKDGKYYCVISNINGAGSAEVLMYQSEDAFKWEFLNVIYTNERHFGLTWEHPDFFELDGKWVLLASTVDMLPEGFEYHNGYGALCLIGEFDETAHEFTPTRDQSVDYGIEFYAPQTFLTPDGRRVMIAWMQHWNTSANRNENSLWFGQMTLPRELSVKNGRLYQQPIRELETRRVNQVTYEDLTFSDILRLDGISGRKVDMELTVAAADPQKLYQSFKVVFAQDDAHHTEFSFRPYDKIGRIDRKFSGTRKTTIHQRRTLINALDGAIKLRIILDRYSVEIFINDGEQVMTATFYTPQSADGISFVADGEVKMSVTKYDLKDE
jgi:beta-fructofuranosidase